MPLHLLGKKSWNVYNADNIAKVKRDEAAATAREADEEQRMQEVDAERRLQILRGIQPEPLPETHEASNNDRHDRRPERKRRRLAGEDDTDRDLRIARESNEAAKSAQALAVTSKRSDAPLTDSKGHINLFPEEGPRRKAPKNAEAEAEMAKKKKEYEDQYTMRFSNAAGFKESVNQQPWYSSTGNIQKGQDVDEPVSKDVWGNQDPRRKERTQMKLVADDPMAIIKKGVSDLRHVERERKKWQAERKREMRELKEVERRHDRKKLRRREEDDLDDLNDFTLDGRPRDSEHKNSHLHRHGSRDGSHERSPGNQHDHGHRSRSRKRSRRHSHPRDHDRKDHHVKSNESKRSVQLPTPSDKPAGWEKTSGSRYSSQFAHC